MAINPRKELETLLKKVKAQSLLNTVKQLDNRGRDIVLRGLRTQLTDTAKQSLVSELRNAASAADREIRDWLVKSISDSYVHGMNYTTKVSSIEFTPPGTQLFKWSDTTPEVDTLWEKIRLVGGDDAGTVGDGIYFSLDPDSSKQFGNQLNSFVLPKKYKLFDISKGGRDNPFSTNFKLSDLQKRAFENGVDVIEQARREGYDGVIFTADDGVNKWVGLNKEVAKVGLVPFIPQVAPVTVSIVSNSAEFSPHLRAINALLQDSYLDFGNAMTSFVRSGEKILNDALKQQIRSTIIQGRLEGDAIREITANVKDVFSSRGFIGLTDRSGRNWSLDRYSEMLTRTHIIRANNEGAINRAKDFDVDIVEISTHASACPICQPFEGQFFSISGTDSKYPPLAGGNEPPYHPNCKHTIFYRPDLGDGREN